MALATLHIAMIPVLAGLAAGTGAIATYGPAPAAPAVAAAEAPARDCRTQAWPYVDRSCVVNASTATDRAVRVVTPSRPSEAFQARWVDVPPTPVTPAGPGLTTSDGVLRGPQNVDAIADVPAQPPKAKRHEVKREKRTRDVAHAPTQRFEVPVERSDETREVIVIRPLRYD
jgi:hypothetical protein